jgi:hypothetical protein
MDYPIVYSNTWLYVFSPDNAGGGNNGIGRPEPSRHPVFDNGQCSLKTVNGTQQSCLKLDDEELNSPEFFHIPWHRKTASFFLYLKKTTKGAFSCIQYSIIFLRSLLHPLDL